MSKTSKSGSNRRERLQDVACPFCSLLCDDLSLTVTKNKIIVAGNDCHRARFGFEADSGHQYPQIEGQRVSQTAAIKAAVKLLHRGRRPLISGLGTDIEGVREAIHLAELSKAIVDHGNSADFDSGMRVMQKKGWYMTTLAELRNRSDLVVIVGADIVGNYENFSRRFLAPKQNLHLRKSKRRRVFYIGDIATAPKSTNAPMIESIDCDSSRIAEVMAALRARISGRLLQAKRVAKTRMGEIETLGEAIKEADYPVFVWAPAHLPSVQADLTIQSITQIIDDLNKTQRAAGLALGGDNGGMSAANVCTWLTGYPLHVSFAGKTIDYDPVQYKTSTLLENESIDTLVWIDSIGNTAPPATNAEVKRILIGRASTEQGSSPDVFIPVGVPGIDHAGTMIRTDSVVSIRLDQVRMSRAPSVRKIIRSIVEQW